MDPTTTGLLGRGLRIPNTIKKNSKKGIVRIFLLCMMWIITPAFLLGIPLYMRNFVYREQVYPLGMSDIRLVDSRISTVWCQAQTVMSNAVFNAFLMPQVPEIHINPTPVTMTRRIILKDDMKEYWGFYLLKNSVVTVSTCARWPGASLIIIKGHKHLKQCAYIGDDSSEELEEMVSFNEIHKKSNKDPLNHPAVMTKVGPDILLKRNYDGDNSYEKEKSNGLFKIHPFNDNSMESTDGKNAKDIKNSKTDNKIGKEIHLEFAEHQENIEKLNNWKAALEFYLSQDKHLKRNFSSTEIFHDMLKKLKKLGPRGKTILENLNKELSVDLNKYGQNKIFLNENIVTKHVTQKFTDSDIGKEKILNAVRNHSTPINYLKNGKKQIQKRGINSSSLYWHLYEDKNELNSAKEDMNDEDEIPNIHKRINETTINDQSDSEFWSSFSSSEEQLINCDGLLLNLPLYSNRKCEPARSNKEHLAISHQNMVTYKVSSNGYYFFIFNSENEVHDNFLSINFELEKTTYNLTKTENKCVNSTEPCSLPLRFWSSQKVVLELPVNWNESLWNEEFVAWSTCEPRTFLYACFVLSLPLSLILFAFQ